MSEKKDKWALERVYVRRFLCQNCGNPFRFRESGKCTNCHQVESDEKSSEK